jgi:hypothetical protein
MCTSECTETTATTPLGSAGWREACAGDYAVPAGRTARIARGVAGMKTRSYVVAEMATTGGCRNVKSGECKAETACGGTVLGCALAGTCGWVRVQRDAVEAGAVSLGMHKRVGWRQSTVSRRGGRGVGKGMVMRWL